MAKYGFKFLELDRSQVRHVPSDHLVLEEGEFFRYGRFDEPQLVREFVIGVGREVIFFNVSFFTLLVEER